MAAGVALGLCAGATMASAESAIENLAGKWSGQGALETSSGQRETVKCVVVYELKSANTTKSEGELRGVLGCFLFSGDEVFKKIKVLSGGEKSRVALAKTGPKPSLKA